MRPAVWAEIDNEALRHNLARVRELAPGARVMAVIKANGYGHGLERVARALEEADAFVVARLDEALALRRAAIEKPLIVLEGPQAPEELEIAVEEAIQFVIHHFGQIEMLENAVLKGFLDLWLKIDSGMHRKGVAAGLAQAAWWRLQDCQVVNEVGLMTHLASADERESDQTPRQLTCFQAATAGLDAARSIANSAAVVAWPDSHSDWIRPGIMLYGVSPFEGERGCDLGLRPAMRLKSRLIAVNRFRAGDPVGYGASWICPEDMPVGVVGCGYGDGYPRHAPPGTPVVVGGRRVSLVGRVSMDTICVDLREYPDAKVGEEVMLWGGDPAVEEVAGHAGTIAYELLCRLTSRVAFQE